ncbi:MAG: PD-(D/E)XK nuclease family protein [Longimicrobiales bacterium]
MVRELIRILQDGKPARRLLVGRTRGEGKEFLRQVALRGVSWAGMNVTTLRPLAMEIAATRLAEDRLNLIDPFDEQALVEQAIDEVLAGGQRKRFHELINKVGFREAVRNSVSALRLGGVHVGRLAVASIDDSEKQSLVTSILGRFEHLLDAGGWVDTASVLEMAEETARENGLGSLQGTEMYFIPGLSGRGVVGRFARTLESAGATLLKTDSVEGLKVPKAMLLDVAPPENPLSYLHGVRRYVGPPPEIEFFSAASMYDELRGVLRRVVSRGARWDEVEVITPDPSAYGSALHALGSSLGIPVTFAVGLPVERTRPGRVVSEYFRWLESGFQESVLRGLIEAGDIGPPQPHDWMHGPRLARALRGLRIGWGRDRYLAAVARAFQGAKEATIGRHENQEQFDNRIARTAQDLEALKSLLTPLLKSTPRTPETPADSDSDEVGTVSPADVAGGVLAILDRVTLGTDTDETALARLKRILERIRATLLRKTDVAAATTIVRGYLEIRIPAPRAEGTAPWSSAPGHLYLTDLVNGGSTGRAHTFIVGMDSGRFPGRVAEDPLLLDGERWRLGRGELPTTRDRIEEHKFQFAQLVARIRGRLTMSYARWDPSEARSLAPAAELLMAYRLQAGDPTLTFAELDTHLGDAESRVPQGPGRLDGGDVWLGLLATEDGRLLHGLNAVRSEFPRLDRGMAAADAMVQDLATVHLGALGPLQPPASYEDPLSRVYSASRLSDLGTCPRRFLFKSVLKAYPPDDPEFDPDRWLNALQRGSLLHSVYEQALRTARDKELAFDAPDFKTLVLELVEREANRMRIEVPTPSKAVQEWELEGLREDARSFVEMIRSESPNWLALELKFGFDGKESRISMGDESVSVRGAIDRVDDLGTHLRVVDYKTGSFRRYDKKSGVYDGGRRLQNLIYSAVVEATHNKPVRAMEYHFPTRRGENRVQAYEVEGLVHGGHLIGRMLEGVQNGFFPATDNAADCRFCDYQEVCGVQVGRYGIESPLADWSDRHLAEAPELRFLRAARKWEDEEPVF